MLAISWLQVSLGAIGAFALSFLLHSVDIDRLEDVHRKELTNQIASDNQACDKDKAILKGTQDELQKSYNAIAARNAELKRMHPSTCVVLPSSGETNPTTGRGEHAGQNGTAADAFRDYAAECETYRTQRSALERFIDHVWEQGGVTK